MSRTLDTKLLLADQTFLTTLSGGTAAIDAFTRLWADIQESLEQAIEQKCVSTATLTLARQVTDRVQLVTERFLELYDEMDAFSPALFELKSLFHELSLDEESKATIYKPVIDDITATLSSIPPYIKPAYAWLLENLHNPYPSKEMKMSIAEESGSSVTYVENWFRDVRKRIGWTALCKSRFSNKRSLIVQMATKYFKNAPSVLKPFDLTDFASPEFDQEFYQIENNAKQLYEGKLRASSLAVNIDSTTNNSTLRQERVSQDRSSATPSDPSLSYPSPQPSPQTSSPILPSVSLPISETIVEPSGSNKRRARSPDFDDVVQSHKRQKIDNNTTRACADGLVSPYQSRGTTPNTSYLETTPALSTSISITSTIKSMTGTRKRSNVDDEQRRRRPTPFHDANGQLSSSGTREELPADGGRQGASLLSIVDLPVIPEVSASIPSQSGAKKRKRRLSDSDNGTHPKRPHNALITPRLQAVSDPLPMPQRLTEEWWQADLPTDLTVAEASSLPSVDIFSQTEPLDIQYNGYFGNVLDIPGFPVPTENTQNHCSSSSSNFVNLEAIDPLLLSIVPNLPGQQGSKDLFSVTGPGINVNNEPYSLLANNFNAQELSLQLSLPDDASTLFPLADDITLSAFMSFPSFGQTLPEWTPQASFFPINSNNNVVPSGPISLSSQPVASLDDKIAKHERAKRLREELKRLEADLAAENQL